MVYDIQSQCIEDVWRHFNGTENEIWAGFGPVGNTEINNWANYEQLLSMFFSCFHGQKKFFFFKYLSVRTQ